MADFTLRYRSFGRYTKAALADAGLKGNLEKLSNLLDISPANSGRDLAGGPGPGAKPEFDRIDPISRQIIQNELFALYDASTNKDAGTTTSW